MTDASPYPPLRVSREIPLPTTISEAARGFLAAMAAQPLGPPPPAADDVEGWESRSAASDAMLVQMLPAATPGTRIDQATLGGVPVYDVTPASLAHDDLVCLYLHGGGLTMGAGEACAVMTAGQANRTGMRHIAVDYRMPPRFPYPAALDDSVAAYRALLETWDPGKIVVAGGSAGGNLAAALILRARDEGLPLPLCAILISPEIDLTESGDSFETLMGIDAVLTSRLTAANELYAGGHDLADPYVSPLFGDFSAGFPPTFVQAGTRDLFLSNAVRFHRALRKHGLPAELHVFEGMPHGGFFGFTPEDGEVDDEVRRFVAAQRLARDRG